MVKRVEFAALNTIKIYVADPHQFIINFDKKEKAKNVLETLLKSKESWVVQSSRDCLKTLLEKDSSSKEKKPSDEVEVTMVVQNTFISLVPRSSPETSQKQRSSSAPAKLIGPNAFL